MLRSFIQFRQILALKLGFRLRCQPKGKQIDVLNMLESSKALLIESKNNAFESLVDVNKKEE